MLADKRKIATQCFAKATEALNKRSFDYAAEMLGKCVEMVPDNLMYRQTLRGSERRKYEDNKTGARMSGLKLMGIRGRIKKARAKEDWPAVDQAAEEGLQVNPWDPQLNADVAEACLRQGFLEIAAYAYGVAVENDPQNKVFLRSLAQVLELRGAFDEAVKVWDRIYKLDPDDAEARRKAIDVHAAKLMHKVDDATSTRDIRREEDVPKTAYDEGRSRARPGHVESVAPGDSRMVDLQHAIRKEPQELSNYLKLAAVFRGERNLEEARRILQQALGVSGNNHTVREELENVELEQMRNNVELARNKAAAADEDDEQPRKMAARLAKELLDREIEVLSSRVERYPADLKIKYELARKFMRVQRWTDAIQLLQRSAGDVRIQADVTLSLGKCFLQVKNNVLAERQLSKAVESMNPQDHAEKIAETRYLLGRICEEADRLDDAETHYNEVLAVDYAYKDAQKRLERIQARGKT